MAERFLVFVYGTLRRGASNAWRMEGAEFIGAGCVRGRLYRIDWYPGLVRDDAAGPVRGEVFRVDGALLETLDAYEGNEYAKVTTTAVLDDGGALEVMLWEYREDLSGCERIEGGDWVL